MENNKLSVAEVLRDFCMREYGYDADAVGNDGRIALAYTETSYDGEHEIQAYANLRNHTIERTLDDEVVDTEEFDSLDDMCDYMRYMSFEDLVCPVDDYYERVVLGLHD